MRQIFLLISILLTHACIDQEASDEYNSFIKSKVPADLISQMPEKIQLEDFVFVINAEPENGRYLADPVHVYISYSVKNVDSLYKDVQSISKARYKYTDTCNVIVHKHQKDVGKSSAYGREWLYKKWVDQITRCDTENFPIPNFIGVGKDEINAGLSEDYDLFILEAQKGVHFPNHYYAEPLIMPSGWEHGHSKGYAISKKANKAIFWFVIW